MERDERDEYWAVRSWRYEQARAVGLSREEASRFADSDGDVEQLRRLVQTHGCDPHVAALIVV